MALKNGSSRKKAVTSCNFTFTLRVKGLVQGRGYSVGFLFCHHANTKRGTLNQRFVMHVVPPLTANRSRLACSAPFLIRGGANLTVAKAHYFILHFPSGSASATYVDLNLDPISGCGFIVLHGNMDAFLHSNH